MKYTGGTLFVDHYSAFIFHQHQEVSLNVGETLQGKHDFKCIAKLHRVKIQRYRADNHPCNSAEFRDNIALQAQNIEFSGTGAHSRTVLLNEFANGYHLGQSTLARSLR